MPRKATRKRGGNLATSIAKVLVPGLVRKTQTLKNTLGQIAGKYKIVKKGAGTRKKRGPKKGGFIAPLVATAVAPLVVRGLAKLFRRRK